MAAADEAAAEEDSLEDSGTKVDLAEDLAEDFLVVVVELYHAEEMVDDDAVDVDDELV